MKTLWFALLGCMVGGAWSGAGLAWSEAGAEPPLPELRVPPESRRHAWPQGLRLNGIPVAVQLYEWPLGVADALDWVVSQFDTDLLVRPHRQGWLMSPQETPAWVLTLQARGADHTLVTLSAWNHGSTFGVATGVSRQATPAWLPPGGSLRLGLEQAEGVQATTAVSIYSYRQMAPDQLAHELERGLVAHGWQPGVAPGFSSWWRQGRRVDFVTVAHEEGSALFLQQDSRQREPGVGARGPGELP